MGRLSSCSNTSSFSSRFFSTTSPPHRDRFKSDGFRLRMYLFTYDIRSGVMYPSSIFFSCLLLLAVVVCCVVAGTRESAAGLCVGVRV